MRKKYRLLRKIIFFAFFWIILAYQTSIVFALDPNRAVTQYIHDIWKTEDGLPQSTIIAMTQTRDGYIWLGTQEGLVRFDGVRFSVFDKRNTPEIKTDYISALFEDREGSLWIGTFGGGLNRVRDGKFMSYTREEGLSHDLVRVVCEDSEGALWIGTDGGLNRLKGDKFTVYTTNEGLSHDAVRAIIEDRKGNLWIGTYGGGLNRLKDGKFTVYTEKEGLSHGLVRAVYEDREGNLWIGTEGGGLNRLKDGKFTYFTSKQGLSHDIVTSIFEDQEGNLWIGTYGGGLNRLTGGMFTSFTMREGLSNDIVWSILADREGSLWVGTYEGLDRLRDGKFLAYSTAEGLAGDDIRSIFEDEEGAIWIGTRYNGVSQLRDGKFMSFTTKEGLSHGLVRAVYGDTEGNLWIGTEGGGLNRLKGGKIRVYTSKDGLSNDIVWSIYESKDGSLWVGTNNGLSRLRNGKFTVFTMKEGLANNVVRSICESKDGSLWIGTEGGGLNRLKEGKFTTYTTECGLSNNIIASLYEDKEGILWIGTYNGGLNRFKDGKFSTYTTSAGLFNDIIYTILEDGRENLWISCNKGIFRVSKKELDDFANGKSEAITSVSYGVEDGMKNQECNGGNQPAGWKSRDGKLWFPTLKGVVVIDPENIKLNPRLPPVIIEQVLVDEEPIDLNENIQLVPGRKMFEFHYTGLSFLAPERVKFKYILEGFEKEWKDVGARRIAYFTNIPPGHYQFKVKACNNDGVWNEEGASFSFYLRPYFYQTPFFYMLCGLCVVAVGAGGFKIRVSQMKTREKNLTELVEKRTEELSSVMRQLESANVELERLSMTDRLTDLANRRRFEVVLVQEWRRCIRDGSYMSLIMVDIDFFKTYNDTYGHPKGDECLKQVAEVLRSSIHRVGDLAARYGGEEFVVILSNTNSEGASLVAEKMRSKLENLSIPHASSSVSAYVTVSAGVASAVPDRNSSADMLISAADQALYEAKQKGRNCVKSVTP